jgi:hypothetical protein
MSYLQEFHELNDSAQKARELSDQLHYKITRCLDNLGEFLNEQTDRPAIVEPYQPII